MEYTVDNVTLDICIMDEDITGDCSFRIPFKDKEFLKDNCSVRKNPEFTYDGHEPAFFS
jgi:hypothetical protein